MKAIYRRPLSGTSRHARNYRVDWSDPLEPSIELTDPGDGVSLAAARREIITWALGEISHWRDVIRRTRRLTMKSLCFTAAADQEGGVS